jgi:hypothetical protein
MLRRRRVELERSVDRERPRLTRVAARLARGEHVDPSEYYLRTAPFVIQLW